MKKGLNIAIVLVMFIVGVFISPAIYTKADGGDISLIHACVKDRGGDVKIVGANSGCPSGYRNYRLKFHSSTNSYSSLYNHWDVRVTRREMGPIRNGQDPGRVSKCQFRSIMPNSRTAWDVCNLLAWGCRWL